MDKIPKINSCCSLKYKKGEKNKEEKGRNKELLRLSAAQKRTQEHCTA